MRKPKDEMAPALDPLFDALPDGVCVTDGDGNVLYMNPAAQRLLGLDSAKLGGKTLCETLCGHLETSTSKECASTCPLRRPLGAETFVTFEGRHGPHGSYAWTDFQIRERERWENLRVRCLKAKYDDQDRHFVIIENLQAETELDRHREDWRNMIAHDLRSPIASIFATLRTLQDKGEGQALDDQDEAMIGISVRACHRMLSLLDLYGDIVKLDAGKMPVNPEAVGVLEIVKKCAEEQKGMVLAKKQKMEIAIDPSLQMRADPELLFRVIQNILDNAVKYTPGKGAVIVTAKPFQGRISLSIKDTGIGIAAEDVPFIFDRFYQAQARREGRIQGIGLGLAFVREALRVMEGDISVKAKPGEGSEFTVDLPAAVPAEIAAAHA